MAFLYRRARAALLFIFPALREPLAAVWPWRDVSNYRRAAARPISGMATRGRRRAAATHRRGGQRLQNLLGHVSSTRPSLGVPETFRAIQAQKHRESPSKSKIKETP
jgi:hypothetical protein